MKTVTTQKAVYTIEEETTRRVVTFENGAPVWGDSTQWLIRRDGVLVGAAYNEETVEEVIEEIENPFRAPFSSRFD